MRVRSNILSVPVTGLAMALTLSIATGALASGSHSGGHGHGAKVGAPGKAADVTKTVAVVMTDNKFTPGSISIKKGQTVRFVVTNKGEFVHEFNIGTAAMHVAHRKEMMAMVESGMLQPDRINRHMMNSGGHGGSMGMRGGAMPMTHDDPNSVLLEPGKSGEILWKFDADARLEFACNVPGHYESGMVGRISVMK